MTTPARAGVSSTHDAAPGSGAEADLPGRCWCRSRRRRACRRARGRVRPLVSVRVRTPSPASAVGDLLLDRVAATPSESTHQLAGGVLHADLDLHRRSSCLGRWSGCLRSCAWSVLVRGSRGCRARPARPRAQRRPRWLDLVRPSASQNRALTWAIPTRETASSRDCSSGRPVSSWITSAIISAHSRGHPVDALAHGGLVGQVGLEDQPERAGLAGDVVVEDVHGRGDAHACCRRWRRAPRGSRR